MEPDQTIPVTVYGVEPHQLELKFRPEDLATGRRIQVGGAFFQVMSRTQHAGRLCVNVMPQGRLPPQFGRTRRAL